MHGVFQIIFNCKNYKWKKPILKLRQRKYDYV